VSTEAYELLADLAERELALVRGGRIEELAAIAGERLALIATLPRRAPLAAGGALARAAGLQRETEAELEARLSEAGRELAGLARNRHALRAYAPH
jgi:hypothetical protein